MLHLSPQRPSGARILFLPNWRVHTWRSGQQLQAADVYPSDGRYWFFRHFSIEHTVDVLDAASWSRWRLEERYLHFYVWQAVQAARLLNHYDLVFVFGSQSAVALLALMRVLRLPGPRYLVDDAGCLNGGRPDERLRFEAVRWSLAAADAILWHSTASEDLCSRCCPELHEKGFFIPLGINDYDFEGATVTDGDYAVCVGDTQRDWQSLVRAWTSLPDVPLKLLGAPSNLRDLCANVMVLPRLPFLEYRDIVARSRLVVLPLPEGYASWGQMTLLQAMALGKPVVVTDVRPVADYIEVGCSVVPPGNDAALVAAVRRLWDSPEERRALGLEARGVVAGKFTERIMARRIELIVQGLLS